jgi:thioester reductase-like protein
VISGDLARPGLGMPAADFTALTRDVTHVVHCAARVSMALPYRALYAANVASTQQLLDVAAAGGAAFCFIGSISAVSPLSVGEPFELSHPVKGGYAQSKWAADRLASVAHQEGRVNVLICRPGRVTADSRTARGNPDDLLEWLIRACIRLGAVPDLITGVRLSPVDWASEIIVRLTLREEAYGQAFHVVSAEFLPWTEVVDVLDDTGCRLIRLPYPQWRAAVLDLGKEDQAAALMSQALTERPPVFDRGTSDPDRARQVLGEELPALGSARALLADTIGSWRQAGMFAGSCPVS